MEVLQTSPLTTWVRRPAIAIGQQNYHAGCGASITPAPFKGPPFAPASRANSMLSRRLAHRQLNLAGAFVLAVAQVADNARHILMALRRVRGADPMTALAIKANREPLPGVETALGVAGHLLGRDHGEAVMPLGRVEAHESYHPLAAALILRLVGHRPIVRYD